MANGGAAQRKSAPARHGSGKRNGTPNALILFGDDIEKARESGKHRPTAVGGGVK
jgi:hypothetical protein